jgi:ketosteroid isomerase-like protein
MIAMLSSTVSADSVPANEMAEAQLRSINHRFVNAFITAGGSFIDELTDPDFLLTSINGEWIERADHLAAMRKPHELTGVSYRDVEVRLFGPVALVHGVFEGILPSGKLTRLRYTDVYAWQGAAWRLVNAQNTLIKDGVSIARLAGTAPAHSSWIGRDPTGDDTYVLRKLNEQYVQSFRQSDVAWYDAHLAPDYVVVSNDGSYHDRAAALANFAKPTFATFMKSFPVDKVTIRRFGDVALIHAENAYEMKDGAKRVSRYTDIWRKQDGHWRCVSAHITNQPSPAI